MLPPFLIGGVGYPLIEIAYRRRTHPSMALAGGLGMCALRMIYRSQKSRPLWRSALLGGLCITGIEYAVGAWLNQKHTIWDYRKVPLNVRGQVCAPFFAVWCGLSAAALCAMRAWDRRRS